MKLGNPNLDEVQWNCLPEREKVIIERPFKEKWWKHLLIFPQDLHRARLHEEEAGLDNLLVLFPRRFPDPSNHRATTLESQDNEWNQAMLEAKINWANALTVLNGVVPSCRP